MLSVPIILGAFVAGVLMFLAPCTLPIVPGYLAFIAGERKRVMQNAIAFVLGFMLLFVLLGASAGLFGLVIGSWRFVLARLGGLVIALFGLMLMGVLRVPLLSAERHIALPRFIKVGNPSSSALIGALFALGWSPCIGPILGTIIFTAAASATAASGALLLLVFSLGLGLPFIAVALLLERAQRFMAPLSRISGYLSIVGGAFLVLIGLLMLLGQGGLLVSWGFGLFDGLGYQRLLKYM
jgi:cytochrome c-type biogenesis protein